MNAKLKQKLESVIIDGEKYTSVKSLVLAIKEIAEYYPVTSCERRTLIELIATLVTATPHKEL